MPDDDPLKKDEFLDKPLYYADKTVTKGWKMLPMVVQVPLVWLYLSLSPSVPISLRDELTKRGLTKVFLTAYGVALLFCLGATVALCQLEGTRAGTNPDVRYLSQDPWNLFLYAVVCPSYVGIAVCLITITLTSWSKLADYADAAGTPLPATRHPGRLVLYSVLVVVVAMLFTVRYMTDVLNLPPTSAAKARLYWFLKESGGVRTINGVGFYYVLLNFLLLVITILGVTSYLSLASEVCRAACAVDRARIEGFDALKERLRAFTLSYAYAKALAACYVVNVAVWADSPLAPSGPASNLAVAQILLMGIGGYFIAFPQELIQLRWYELLLSSGEPVKVVNLQSRKAFWATKALDFFFVGSVSISGYSNLIKPSVEALLKRWQ